MREQLYIALVKSYSGNRASLNEMEDLMLSAARGFTMEITFVRLGRSITCLVGPRTNWNYRLEFTEASDSSRDDFGLLDTQNILEEVIAEQLTIAEAMHALDNVEQAASQSAPLGHTLAHFICSGLVSAAVFSILNESNMEGAHLPAIGAILLSAAHILLRHHNHRLAQIYEYVDAPIPSESTLC